MNTMHRVCKKVVVGVFLASGVASGCMHAMACVMAKPEVKTQVLQEQAPIAIAVAKTLSGEKFCPQLESAFSYWISGSQDEYADCKAGVKAISAFCKKARTACIQKSSFALAQGKIALAQAQAAAISWLEKKELAWAQRVIQKQEQKEAVANQGNSANKNASPVSAATDATSTEVHAVSVSTPLTWGKILIPAGKIGLVLVAGGALFYWGYAQGQTVSHSQQAN